MDTISPAAAARRPSPLPLDVLRAAPLTFAGAAALVLPTLVRLAQQIWTTEAGVHGPIVLATGIWLLVRRWPEVAAVRRPGSAALAVGGLLPALAFYVFGRAFDFISLEVGGLIAALVAIFYYHYGAAAVRLVWFPILYLCFLAPIPGWVIDVVTGPLKSWLSDFSARLMGALGYPVAREGVTLYIAQYQLLVADACAGLNSLVSLTAISLFYVYLLHNASPPFALLLMLWIVPIAILANLVRIILLMLITYYLGDEAAQGFLHSTAGLVMFAVALLGVFTVDKVIVAIGAGLSRNRAARA